MTLDLVVYEMVSGAKWELVGKFPFPKMESLKGYEKITYPLNSARAKISAVCLSNLKGKRSWVTLTIMGKLKGKLTSVPGVMC